MEFLQTLQVAVVTAAVPVLVYYGIAFLRGKIISVIQKIDNDTVQETLTRAMEIVMQAVMTVSQTYVDTLKQHGAFTREAQVEAFLKAKAYILEMLSTDAKELLEDIYGDLDVWLETMIESTVNSLKHAGQGDV